MSTTKDKLKEMIELQEEYDQMVFEAHNLRGYDDISFVQLNLAILDELGEYNHERKAQWCWWKKTQKPVDTEKTLEELVDVVHFLLMEFLKYEKLFYLDAARRDYIDAVASNLRRRNTTHSLVDVLSNNLISGWHSIDTLSSNLAALIHESGYRFDDVYEAYKKKNATNRLRIHQGY